MLRLIHQLTGYNSVENYIGATAIIINEAELRQYARDSVSDIKKLSKKFKKEKKNKLSNCNYG